MIKAIIAIGITFSVFCSPPAYCAEPDHDSLVTRVVERDGLNRAFDAIPAVFEAIASQQSLVSPDFQRDQDIYAEVTKSIDLDMARTTVVAHLSSHADDETLRSVLAWLESPIGRKISQEEIRAATEPDSTAMQQYLARLRSAPPSRERIGLMQRFVAQKGLAEALAKITRNVTIAMLTGLSEGGDCTPADKVSIEAELPEHDDSMAETMRQQSILSVIYAYRDITDNEIEQYLQYMTGKSYLKYDAIVREAIDSGMRTLYRNIGKKMAQAYRKHHPDGGCNGCPL